MEANVTVTIDTREVLDLSVLLVALADKPANRLVESLNSLPADIRQYRHNFEAQRSVFNACITAAEHELSQVADKVRQAKQIMEGLERHTRTPITEAESLEGFANFLGRLDKESEEEGSHKQVLEAGENGNEPTEES